MACAVLHLRLRHQEKRSLVGSLPSPNQAAVYVLPKPAVGQRTLASISLQLLPLALASDVKLYTTPGIIMTRLLKQPCIPVREMPWENSLDCLELSCISVSELT